ncbi:hypothetical protein Q1M63_00695 (plasmid) [Sinorhizobium meliloti]|nr:hypothetical protein Q1M63_00695 [Sinorhizobium meliloti]
MARTHPAAQKGLYLVGPGAAGTQCCTDFTAGHFLAPARQDPVRGRQYRGRRLIEVVKKRPCCKMGRSVATRRPQEQLVNWPAQARENSHGGEPTFKQGDGGAP